MRSRASRLVQSSTAAIVGLLLWGGEARAEAPAKPGGGQPEAQAPARPERRQNPKLKRVTHAERQAAANRAKALKAGAPTRQGPDAPGSPKRDAADAGPRTAK